MPCITGHFFALYAPMSDIRKRIALFVTIALLISQSALLFWSNVKQLSYSYINKHRLEINSRDTITLPLASINDKLIIVWVEKDEVHYSGNMFDVALILKSATEVKLIGHYDKVENELFNLLSKVLDTEKKSSSNKKNSFQFTFSEAIINEPHSDIALYESTSKSMSYPFKHIFYSSHKDESDIKPPDYTGVFM